MAVVVVVVVLVMLSMPLGSESAKLPARKHPAGVDFFEHEFTSIAAGLSRAKLIFT